MAKNMSEIKYISCVYVGDKLFKVVLQGYPGCPNSHDLSEYHHPYGLGRHFPQYNSLNFDSKKSSVITMKDHLKT